MLTLSIVSSSIASAVCFPYVQKIIQLLGGKWRAIFFTFVMYFVRYMGISLIRNSWLVLIFQTIHGLTTDLFLVAGVFTCHTSLVSISNATNFGFGTFVGSIISGVIYQRYGGRALFRYTALFSLGWSLVVFVYVFFKERRKRENDDKNSKEVVIHGFKDKVLLKNLENNNS